MPRGSSPKRERQYEHIKEGLEERGEPAEKAKEIAARTVNKERARAGESETASKESLEDMSSSRRGGLHSHTGPEGPTYDQLYAEAKRRNVPGRSDMNKAQLQRALDA
ncbi:plasmid stabilization protein [Streptomyces sp. NPDC055254]